MKENEKMQKFAIIGIVLAAILLISLTATLINTNNTNSGKVSEEPKESESASTQIGKTAKDAANELASNIDFETAELVPNTNTSTSSNETSTQETISTTNNNVSNEEENVSTETETKTVAEVNETEKTQETSQNKEVTFLAPVKGNVIREFARESLVYSDTLKEWITHNGVDIKADKTTVVTSSADGKVYAIKNDPRYGLTVIINHANGYQTIYSNLLTAEFIVEGEDVSAGQSIGTVGNTASFEILDDCHLHFELLQNNEYLDPTLYMNFE